MVSPVKAMTEKKNKDQAKEFHKQEEIKAAQQIADKLKDQTVTIAAKAGVKPSKPAFVNLDQWDETVMDTFQSAYQALQQAQYGDTSSDTLIPSGDLIPDSGSTAADTRR